MPRTNGLSQKSAAVLTLIAQGKSYAQIVEELPNTTFLDVFASADEALRCLEGVRSGGYKAIREGYPNAYMPWTPDDDEVLASMNAQGLSVLQLAAHFQRRPSAIRSRLVKLCFRQETLNTHESAHPHGNGKG